MGLIFYGIFVQCVLLATGRCLEIQSFLDLHAKVAQAIGIDMFITLGRPSDACKGNTNMFITLEILSNVGKGNVVLIRGNTTAEAVPRVTGPKNISSKPHDKVVDSISVCIVSIARNGRSKQMSGLGKKILEVFFIIVLTVNCQL